MTNEEKIQQLEDKIKELEQKIAEMSQWIEQKKVQQISYPLDDASRNIITRI